MKIIREQGDNPITGESIERAEEEISIDAASPQAAHCVAQIVTTLKFLGQEMIILIDGKIHLDEAH